MNNSKIVFTSASFSIFFFMILISLSNGEDDACKTQLHKLVGQHVESFKACHLEIKDTLTKEERSNSTMCIVKCTMIKEGILDDDGTLHITGAMKLLDGFSSDIQTRILDLFTTNCQKHLDSINPNDSTCKTYSPIVKCSQSVIAKICP